MKSLGVLTLSILLAVISAQQQLQETLEEACGTLTRKQCVFRAHHCVLGLQRMATDDASSDVSVLKTCAEENGLQDAVHNLIAREGQGGGIDDLSADQEAKDAMRQCFLQAKGLAEEGGAVHGELFLLWVKAKIGANLEQSPQLRNVFLAAASSCPLPNQVADVPEYRKCIGQTCIQKFP